MGLKNRNQKASRTMWTLIVLVALGVQYADFVHGLDPLGEYYIKLRGDYELRIKNAKYDTDCNVGDTIKPADDVDHHGWGTLTTLTYLTDPNRTMFGKGLNGINLGYGETFNNLAKLRLFLARVGYLKVPGSLVFLNKQTETLRLTGCNDKAMWRTQGERGMDKGFHHTGSSLKIQAPNSANYIHKYICFDPQKCSHTFYVITRLLPELPQGVQLRENVEMPDGDFSFTCAVPYCNIETCKVGKSDVDANRRAYPPYKIWWSMRNRDKTDKIFQGSLSKLVNITRETNETMLLNNYNVKVIWEKYIRIKKEAPETERESYKDVSSNPEVWKDAFGDDKRENTSVSEYSFNSRIIIKKPKDDVHSGLYECIIEDGNGVVSTPSVFISSRRDWKDYRGRTNVFIISQLYLIVCFGISVACIIGVGIIILICPKKMEYDDGTLYTKDELVAPAKKQEPSAIEGNPSSQTKVVSSKKSMKSENSMKQHTE